ncbi:MAG: magnesium chelatase [Chloroflexi bacterium]|nr:magnesium chelatase [Chloroflexota bacterium]
MSAKPATVGQLKESGYQPRTVREEIRTNLIARLEAGGPLFPEIHGYEDTVVPALENALLAEQDVIFLGERGQAKSRMIRAITGLLDDETPVLEGVEIYEEPLAPISLEGKKQIDEHGDDAPIRWIPRADRYGEKLATPDITIADLIGEVDPIKVAEGRYLSDEMTIHFGLIPRTNRGIFCINELPDLAERIQVGLLNIMEERDVQIRGFRVRLPLDVLIVASANPEDYTNRGRIITPLKDRYGAQIRTHYPTELSTEMEIVEQESAVLSAPGRVLNTPSYMAEIVSEIVRLARRSPDVSQRSGVSVRASIAGYETLTANAMRRAILGGEEQVAPRICDLWHLAPALQGKMELETVDEGADEKVIEKLIAGAIAVVFGRYFDLGALEPVIAQFKMGLSVEVGEALKAGDYASIVGRVEGLDEALQPLGVGEDAASLAAAVEFLFEGLHLNKRLNKDVVDGAVFYRA